MRWHKHHPVQSLTPDKLTLTALAMQPESNGDVFRGSNKAASCKVSSQPLLAMAVKCRACHGTCVEAVKMQVDMQRWHLWASRTVSALCLVFRKYYCPV